MKGMVMLGRNCRRIWRARCKIQRNLASRGQPPVEFLERRTLLSGSGHTVTPTFIIEGPAPASDGMASAADISPLTTLSPPFTPTEIVQAYGVGNISFNGVSGNGSGQTIAIVDAFNDPTIIADANTFSGQYCLPEFNTGSGPTLTVLNQTGGTTLPANAPSNDEWDVEESLDVEWAHAIAPQANIVLFEANSDNDSDVYATEVTAAAYPGISVVSNSWTEGEFDGEQSDDAYFVTPGGHQGVTFLASTGDGGAPGGYPAYSPNVIAVGGTSLTINGNGSYGGESGWSGSGGGISSYETQPAYQNGNVNGLSSTYRTIPDVAMDANPSTGVYVLDSFRWGSQLYEVGGTSVSCPLWAGLIAIADQGRVLNGLGTLDGFSQTLPALYNLPSWAFNDITTGNNGFAAGPGYDLVTGRGSPIASVLVPLLAGSSRLAFAQQPTNIAVGSAINPAVTVDVEYGNGSIITSDNSNVTLSVYSGPNGATLQGNVTVAAVNGVATFGNVSLTTVGNYTLEASDGNFVTACSNVFAATPAAAAKLVFVQQPSNCGTGITISPAITVDVEDQFGNIVTSDTSTVMLSTASGPGTLTGTTTITAVGGVATFGNVSLTTAGNHTLNASDGNLTSATSSSFTVVPSISTTTAVASSNGSDSYGQSVTFTATVTPASSSGETGTVKFQIDGGNTGSPVALSGNTASYAISTLSAGNHSIIAIYSGDNFFTTSTSSTFTQAVAKATTATIITSSNSSNGYGQPVTFTATITPASGSGETGTVQFQIDGGNAGSPVAVGGNIAVFTTATLSIGSHGIDAIYSGDGNFTSSTSSTFTQNVAHIATTTSIASRDISAGYEPSATVTAMFDDGTEPLGDLVMDSSGDLFGTTYSGGDNDAGTVFEIASGSGTITTLASFDNTNGQGPRGGVVVDSSGNVFGTTNGGGAYSDGTIYEIAHGSGVITTLASFNGTNGSTPWGNLMMDSSGNLYGTTASGGANGSGTVFEVAHGSGNITTLVSFNGTNGRNLRGGVIMDAAGDIFGTTYGGGAYGNGTVFEIVAGSGIITSLASFNVTNGAHPDAAVVMDAAGDIFGTTYSGGANSKGTVFEIVHGSGTITTLASFNGANGQTPEADLVLDSAGDLFGTTNGGGANSDGTLFEIVHGTGIITTLASFNGTNGQNPAAGVVMDSHGNLFGTTSSDSVEGDGTVFELAVAPAVYAQQVIFTATVTPNVGAGPTGTVQFQIDGGNAGSPVSLSGNIATYTTSTLSIGNHSIDAIYSGDSNFTTSTSLTLTQNVQPLAWLNPGSAAIWNPAAQTFTVTGNATIIGDPNKFGVTANINDVSPSSNLTVDTQVADGGDGDTLVHLGTISGNGTMTITRTNVDIAGNFSQTALVNSGTVEIDGTGAVGQLAGNGSLTIGNGSSNNTVQLTAATTPDSITNTQTSVLISVGSTLDITNNAILLHYGNASTSLATLQAAAAYGAGVNGASGASGSIISSTANVGNPGQYTVGYADSTELTSIATGNVKVMYTLTGDANLDGMVNFNDFSILQNNYETTGDDWSQGDFNHDGRVNFNDFSLLQNNYDSNVSTTAVFSSALINRTATAPAADSMAQPISQLYIPAAEDLFNSDATTDGWIPEDTADSLL